MAGKSSFLARGKAGMLNLGTKARRAQCSTPESWHSVVRAALWALQSSGLFILFCGACSISAQRAGASTAWIWWTIVLHAGCSAAFGVWHLKALSHLKPHAMPLMLASVLSVVNLTLACDRAIMLSSSEVRTLPCFTVETVYGASLAIVQERARLACALLAHWQCNITSNMDTVAGTCMQDSLSSASGVVLSGAILTVACFTPLLLHTVGSLPIIISSLDSKSTSVLLPAAVSLGMQQSCELHYVNLNSAEEGRGVKQSQQVQKGKYTAYSNPYADDATEPGTIQPSLMPQVPPPSTHASCHRRSAALALCMAMFMSDQWRNQQYVMFCSCPCNVHMHGCRWGIHCRQQTCRLRRRQRHVCACAPSTTTHRLPHCGPCPRARATP